MHKIMVVDDADVARREVVDLLTAEGVEVICAQNGKQGVEAFQADRTLTLIITDINMPLMDGLSMLEEIQKLSAPQRIPAVIVSADASSEHKDRGKKAGVVAWVLKPINAKTFIMGIRSLLGNITK